MHWKKLGLIYRPEPNHPKLVSHAANPLPILVEGDVHRVFFSGRDAKNRSSVGFVDMDLAKRKVVYVHNRPVFEHGDGHSFFSHGVSIGNCYSAEGKRFILFMAWQCPSASHWRGVIGRLVLRDDWSMTIDGDQPFMELDETDLVSLSYPWVMKDENGLYRMWYGSTVTWDAGNGEMIHVINQAVSADGKSWKKKGLAVPWSIGLAQAFSRPTVAHDLDEGYQMWFSFRSGRGHTYRIGYANSDDGTKWNLRLDETGIDVSPDGWDSAMIEYPFVFDHRGKRYMLYNGNGYGKSGFGLAVLDSRR